MKEKNEEKIEEKYNIYKMARIARDMSAKDLADKLEVSPAYVHAIESGAKQPSKRLKRDYLEALNLNEEIVDMYSKKVSDFSTYEKLLHFLLELILKLDS